MRVRTPRRHQYSAWRVVLGAHKHLVTTKTEPYRAPLCAGGLMFAKKTHFQQIGGFSEAIKKWGGTDVEISLKNYMLGGDNLVDPRVFIFHYYKNRTDRKPTFSISYRQTFFNRLLIAKTFCTDEVYQNAKRVLGRKGKIDELVAEVESAANLARIEELRQAFVRHWADFTRDFELELKGCFGPVD